jgi:hypothetical protein
LEGMNGTKHSSSFSVKDILDLPKGKNSCSPVDSETPTVNSNVLSSIPSVPDVADLPGVNGPSCITSLVSFSRSHVSRIVKTVTITVSLSY